MCPNYVTAVFFPINIDIRVHSGVDRMQIATLANYLAYKWPLKLVKSVDSGKNRFWGLLRNVSVTSVTFLS